MKRIENLKSQAKALCLALATVNHVEFTHLNQLARIKDENIKLHEYPHNKERLMADIRLNVSSEWANLFHSIDIVVKFHYEGENITGGSIQYSYDHPQGGSNGHDLCRFSYDNLSTIIVRYERLEPTGGEIFGKPEYRANTYKIELSI